MPYSQKPSHVHQFVHKFHREGDIIPDTADADKPKHCKYARCEDVAAACRLCDWRV